MQRGERGGSTTVKKNDMLYRQYIAGNLSYTIGSQNWPKDCLHIGRFKASIPYVGFDYVYGMIGPYNRSTAHFLYYTVLL